MLQGILRRLALNILSASEGQKRMERRSKQNNNAPLLVLIFLTRLHGNNSLDKVLFNDYSVAESRPLTREEMTMERRSALVVPLPLLYVRLLHPQ